jgi:hypothetical protein
LAITVAILAQVLFCSVLFCSSGRSASRCQQPARRASFVRTSAGTVATLTDQGSGAGTSVAADASAKEPRSSSAGARNAGRGPSTCSTPIRAQRCRRQGAFSIHELCTHAHHCLRGLQGVGSTSSSCVYEANCKKKKIFLYFCKIILI